MLPICILTIQDEDDRAYMSRLFVQYHRLMYQCTYEVLDDKWATEDAVQTTLLRLIQYPAVIRQKIVSVISPRNAPIKNSSTIL